MPYYYRFFSWCLCLSLTVLTGLAGCGTSTPPPVVIGSNQPAPAFAGVMPFPADRQLAALSTSSLDGNQASPRSSGATDQGTSLMITATGKAEYGIYTFNPNNTPNQISLTITEAQTSAYWVALANYTLGRWELDGPFATSQSFALGLQHLSGLGNFSIAVLAPPGESVQVDLLQLSSDNDPPVADIGALPTSGPAPLIVQFDASASTDAEGAIAEYEWEFETGGGFTSTGNVASTSHPYLTQGTYTARVRVTDAGGLIDIDTIDINATAPINTPPNAVLTGPADGPAPFAGDFDASGSSDPDVGDSITNYRWDLDNDGTFNEAGAEAAVEGSATASIGMITQPGSYTVSVEVTDETGGLGGTDTASDTVVATGWKIFTLSSNGDETGRLNDLKLINGKPAIAYHVSDGSQNPSRSLYYAYSATDTGGELADWTTVDITPAFLNGGQQLSLCEVNGNPAISVYGGPTVGDAFRLAYVRSTTASGSSSSDWQVVHPTTVGNGFGFTSSLAVINGNPAIAYQGPSDDTCYIRSTTPTGMVGADWGAPVIIDGAAWTSGQYLSLADAGGNPAIAYYDQEPVGSSLHLKYARAKTATGQLAADWTGAGSTKIEIDAASGFFPCMTQVNGNPAIAYWSHVSDDLKYAYSTTASGSQLGDWLVVDADGGVDNAGVLPSLAVINGVPTICHQAQGAEFDLELAAASTATGGQQADWPADSTKVDEPGDVGGYCHMIDANGYAAIVYFENNPVFALKYAVLFD